MQKPTGGPAFPIPGAYTPNGEWMWGDNGMTLRDYFAAKAMNGLLAQFQGVANACDPAHHATWAYQMADAMLLEREK